MMKRFLRKLLMVFPLLILSAACGCAHQNNDRTYWELIRHFEEKGLHIKLVNPLSTYQVKAAAAFAFTIGERQVGVYKYDTNVKKHREKLDRVSDTGVFYVVGIRYKAIRNGSFVLIDFEKHPQGEAIAEAFESF